LSSRMMPAYPEASAKAPWTSTTVGVELVMNSLSARVGAARNYTALMQK
jgi:hypothetical protein